MLSFSVHTIIRGWRIKALGLSFVVVAILCPFARPAFGEAAPDFPAPLGFTVPDAPETQPQDLTNTAALVTAPTVETVNPLMLSPVIPKSYEPEHFHWRPAIQEALEFATVMHVKRLSDVDTLPDSGHGNFFVDYIRSVEGLHGWDDHDRFLIQYIQHSFQGASDARIELQNNPNGRSIEWGDPGYWHSRLVAMAWSGFWGAQFKIGPYSEAMIGNVGLANKYRKHPIPAGADYGLMAWSEFVVNPIFGTAWVVGEDALDRYVVRRVQNSGHERMFYMMRSFLTPSRSWANILRYKVPWYRETPNMVDTRQ
jgi:hypothetical protein